MAPGRIGFLFGLVLLAQPGKAQDISEDCTGKSVACVTELLGEPTERRHASLIEEYQELQARYGKYGDSFYGTPQGNVGYSGALRRPDGSVDPDQETLIYDHPLIRDAYRLACRVEFNTARQKVIAVVYECARGCNRTNGRSLAAIANDTLPEKCREPLEG